MESTPTRSARWRGLATRERERKDRKDGSDVFFGADEGSGLLWKAVRSIGRRKVLPWKEIFDPVYQSLQEYLYRKKT